MEFVPGVLLKKQKRIAINPESPPQGLRRNYSLNNLILNCLKLSESRTTWQEQNLEPETSNFEPYSGVSCLRDSDGLQTIILENSIVFAVSA